MKQVFRTIGKIFSVIYDTDGIVILTLMFVFVTFGLFKESQNGNISLFIVAVLIISTVVFFCLKKSLCSEMHWSDFWGNVLTSLLITYFGLFAVLRIAPDIEADTFILKLIQGTGHA